MSSLRDKYEQSKRRTYVSRDALAEKFTPRAKTLQQAYENRKSALYASQHGSSAAKRSAQEHYRKPISEETNSGDYSLGYNGYKSNDDRSKFVAKGDDFSPIRTIPFALSSSYSPSSLYKSQAKKSGDGILKSGKSNSGYRISKLNTQRGGVFKRLSLFFLNAIAGKEEAKLETRKRVLFAPSQDKDDETRAIDTTFYENALNEERERNKRMTLSYEQEVRRLEDELDFKDQEYNSIREILNLRDQQEQENLTKLEDSYNQSLRANEEKILEDRLKLLELKQLLNMEKSLIQEETDKIQSEKKKLMIEKKLVEDKLRKYNELDIQRSIERNANTPLRSKMNDPIRDRYASARTLLLKEKTVIQQDLDSNKDQHVRFFETLLRISDSLPKYNERFFLSLDSIVSDQQSISIPKKRFEKLKVLEDKVKEYSISFDKNTSTTRKTLQLSSLFEKLENNLSKSFEKHKRSVKLLDYEIFKVNLILADVENTALILSQSVKSNNYLSYLRLFEHKGSLLEEMKLLNELLLTLNTLTLKLNEKVQLEPSVGNFNNIITSTPRNKFESTTEKISPVDYTTFFNELDRLI